MCMYMMLVYDKNFLELYQISSCLFRVELEKDGRTVDFSKVQTFKFFKWSCSHFILIFNL